MATAPEMRDVLQRLADHWDGAKAHANREGIPWTVDDLERDTRALIAKSAILPTSSTDLPSARINPSGMLARLVQPPADQTPRPFKAAGMVGMLTLLGISGPYYHLWVVYYAIGAAWGQPMRRQGDGRSWPAGGNGSSDVGWTFAGAGHPSGESDERQPGRDAVQVDPMDTGRTDGQYSKR